MTVVRSIDLRDHFKSFCERVFDGETVIVSRPRNENIVMISESEYNDLQKSKQNAAYLKMLKDSMEEARRGNIIVKSVEDYLN